MWLMSDSEMAAFLAIVALRSRWRRDETEGALKRSFVYSWLCVNSQSQPQLKKARAGRSMMQ